MSEQPENPRSESSSALHLDRRTFVASAGAMEIIAGIDTSNLAQAAPVAASSEAPAAGTVPVSFRVNGQPQRVHADPRARRCSTVCARRSR
jgi:hypothetical protein